MLNVRKVTMGALSQSMTLLSSAPCGLDASRITEASLSFLGFGLSFQIPGWGGMLSREGRQYMENLSTCSALARSASPGLRRDRRRGSLGAGATGTVSPSGTVEVDTEDTGVPRV